MRYVAWLPLFLLSLSPPAAYGSSQVWEVNSNVYYFKRDRQRFDYNNDKYITNLNHETLISSLAINNIPLLKNVTAKVGGYAVADLAVSDRDKVHQENEFSFAAKRWGDNYAENDDSKSNSGLSVLNLAATWQPTEKLTINAGYDQFYLDGLIGTNWSFIPGTSRGISSDYISNGLKVRYVFVDRYKAPWYQREQRFSTENAWSANRDKFDIRYLHGLSLNKQVSMIDVSLAWAESEGYMNSQFLKLGYVTPVTAKHNLSYQLYRSDTDARFDSGPNGYQGIAWLQALTYRLAIESYEIKAETTFVKAEGDLGNYLPRLTRGYGNSQGALQIWWDLRSDWNHNNEKAIYLSAKRSLNDWVGVQGWSVRLSAAYGWDAEYQPAGLEDGKESAWAIDLIYHGSVFSVEDVTFQIHYLDYKNHQDELGDWAFPNMFSSEKDLMFKLSVSLH